MSTPPPLPQPQTKPRRGRPLSIRTEDIESSTLIERFANDAESTSDVDSPRVSMSLNDENFPIVQPNSRRPPPPPQYVKPRLSIPSNFPQTTPSISLPISPLKLQPQMPSITPRNQTADGTKAERTSSPNCSPAPVNMSSPSLSSPNSLATRSSTRKPSLKIFGWSNESEIRKNERDNFIKVDSAVDQKEEPIIRPSLAPNERSGAEPRKMSTMLKSFIKHTSSSALTSPSHEYDLSTCIENLKEDHQATVCALAVERERVRLLEEEVKKLHSRLLVLESK